MNLTERINDVIKNYVITTNNQPIDFGSILTEIVEFEYPNNTNKLSEEECIKCLERWVEYCLKNHFIKSIENISLNNKEN